MMSVPGGERQRSFLCGKNDTQKTTEMHSMRGQWLQPVINTELLINIHIFDHITAL